MSGTPIPVRHPPSVLVCGRTEWLARSFESILTPHGLVVTRTSDREDALARFDALAPDVVLLEPADALEGAEALCRAMRAHPRLGSSTPVLVVSAGAISRTERLAAMRAGAWDAFGFPLDPEELVLKVRALASVRREVEEAEERGLLDPDTGLYNARGLVRRAQEMVAEAYRHHRPLACIAFTAAPEDASPEEAEAGAATVAELLRAAGRTSDVIGRLQSSEFAVLAPATGWEGASRLAERLGGTLQRELDRGQGGVPVLRIYSGRFAIDGTPSARVQAVELLGNAAHDLRAALAAASSGDGHGKANGNGKGTGNGNGHAHAGEVPIPPTAAA